MRKKNKYLKVWFHFPPSRLRRLFRFSIVDKARPKFGYYKANKIGSGIRTRFYVYIMVRL